MMGEYCQKNVGNGVMGTNRGEEEGGEGGSVNIYKWGEEQMGKIVYGRRAVSNLSHTMIHKVVVIR